MNKSNINQIKIIKILIIKKLIQFMIVMMVKWTLRAKDLQIKEKIAKLTSLILNNIKIKVNKIILTTVKDS